MTIKWSREGGIHKHYGCLRWIKREEATGFVSWAKLGHSICLQKKTLFAKMRPIIWWWLQVNVGWLVGWLFVWLVGWLVDWFGWLVRWLVSWLVGWLVRPFVPPFVCSFVSSFVRLFVCSGVCLFVCMIFSTRGLDKASTTANLSQTKVCLSFMKKNCTNQEIVIQEL